MSTKCKISSFSVGAILICIVLILAVRNNSIACDGYHRSASIPFFVTEGETGYDDYKLLNSPKFWDGVNESLDLAATEFSEEHKLQSNIEVHCVGSSTEYEIFLAYEDKVSSRELALKSKAMAVFVSLVDQRYRQVLNRIN